MFVRIQSVEPHRRGVHPGVFALVNGLRADGLLRAEDAAWVARTNAWMNAAYTDPTSVAPDCYDRALYPGACSWFRETATELLAKTDDYLALLDRYGVPWTRVRTAHPGRILYEDEVQVVTVPEL